MSQKFFESAYVLRSIELLITVFFLVLPFFSEDVTFFQGVVASLLVFVCGEIVNQNIAFTKFKQRLKKSRKFDSTSDLGNVAKLLENCDLEASDLISLIEHYNKICEEGHPVFRHIVKNLAENFRRDVHRLYSGYYYHERACENSFGRIGIHKASKTIDAITTMQGHVGEFWKNKHASDVYLSANADCIDRGVVVRRIFIVDGPINHLDRMVLKKQIDLGIQVYVLDKAVCEVALIEKCFVLLDGEFLSETEFDADGVITGWTQRTDSRRLDKYIGRFETYAKLANIFVLEDDLLANA